ncbi:MAG: Trp biosynthesis-associated membrane protein [Microbacteriaceae bacterium]
MRSARRLKYSVMLVILAGSGLALLAVTQPWYQLRLEASAEHPAAVEITGSAAAPALTALALSGLALVAALAIAGPVIRAILAVLGIIVGASVALAAAIAMADPVHSGISEITAVTGVAGDGAVARLVAAIESTIWPSVALAAGIILAIGSLAAVVTTRRWPSASRKYQAVRFAPESEADISDTAIDSWDELSRGEDPTAGSPPASR